MNSFNDLLPQPPQLQLDPQALLLSPQTFLKLQFFLHAGESQVCGFGISCRQNPLYLRDFITLPQQASPVSTSLEVGAVADHLKAMNRQGLSGEQSARVWICLRPGCHAQPSRDDEQCFEKAAGHWDWSVLLILARSGQSYVRLQYRTGPKSRLLLPLRVHWSAWSQMGSDLATPLDTQHLWQQEYQRHLHLEHSLQAVPPKFLGSPLEIGPAMAHASPLLSSMTAMESELVE